MKDLRIAAVVLALVSAACMLYASFTNQWLVNGNKFERYGFGLRENETCGDSLGETPCDRMSNSEYVQHAREFNEASARNTSSAFAPCGWATFVELLLAAIGLLIAAALAIAKKTPDLPMAPTTLALLAIMASLIT